MAQFITYQGHRRDFRRQLLPVGGVRANRSAGMLYLVRGAGQAAAIREYTIQSGDTLGAIAAREYGDVLLYRELFAFNDARGRLRSGSADLIYPGETILIPPRDVLLGEVSEEEAAAAESEYAPSRAAAADQEIEEVVYQAPVERRIPTWAYIAGGAAGLVGLGALSWWLYKRKK